MSTSKDIHRQMAMCLPCEIQQIILKNYTQKYIFTELLKSPQLKRQQLNISLHDKITRAIVKYVKMVHSLHHTNVDAFNICIDILEERLLEDEWYVWEGTQQTLLIINLTRLYVATPNLLKIEIEGLRTRLFRNNSIYGMKSFLKTTIMMTKML